MSQFSFKQTGQAALLATIAAAFPVVSHAAPAARVDFAVGDVTAVNAAGQARPLGKGAQIEQGETIATNNGRAQLRFTDGAYMSLQPQSEFRIDQYLYEGKEDGSEKGLFSLIKGGLRTITGFVGRTNKRNYQVTTSVATIGIRGTEYTIQYGNSISGTVGEGEIEVCNGAGCLNVTDGETYYVENQDVKPQLSNKGTDLPPAPPENPPSDFKDGENVDESGTPCAIGGACGAPLLTGTITPLNVAVNSANTGQQVEENSTGTFSANGILTTFEDLYWGSGLPVTTVAPIADTGNDGIIAWGRAAGSSGGECCAFDPSDPLHYVAGIPGDIGTIGNMIGTYTLLGATQPTGTETGAVGGMLNSMSMTMDFWSGSLSGAMSWTLESKAITATFDGGMDGHIYASGTTDYAGSSGLTGSVFMQGFFAGTSAERAGFVYEVDNPILSEGYIGAAALSQTGLTAGSVRVVAE